MRTGEIFLLNIAPQIGAMSDIQIPRLFLLQYQILKNLSYPRHLIFAEEIKSSEGKKLQKKTEWSDYYL